MTVQLLPETTFNESIDLLIKQNKAKAPTTFAQLLFLIRSINHGNAIISTYGTNFEYIAPWINDYEYSYAPTQTMVYDDGCLCGLHSNCTTQANFIGSNSSEIIAIKGLKMGCTPSESFLASTLECFYDQSCIHIVQKYTTNTSHITPLSDTMSRFSINTTIAELINNLFVEQWLTKVNYLSYFEQCSPLLCSYNYIENFNLLYTITTLLSLQGGLTIVLKWICPLIVRIIAKVHQYRKRRMNIVQPTCSLEITATDIANENVPNVTSNLETMTTTNVTSRYVFLIFSLINNLSFFFVRTNVLSSSRCSFKVILMCMLLLFMIIALVIFSIYIVPHEKKQVILPGMIAF